MNLLSKNIIIFCLLTALVAVFPIHWFFVLDMAADECMSTSCIYSSSQIMPSRDPVKNFLLIVLSFIFLVALFLHLLLFKNKIKNSFNSSLLQKKQITNFDYNLISWLKILEKRDPYRNF